MEQETLPNNKVILKIDYLPSVNYAMMNNGVDVCNSLVLENNDDKDWHQLSVHINGQYIKDSSCWMEILKIGQAAQINAIKIEPDFKILSETTEAINTSFALRIKCANELLFEQEYPITLLSYEQWAGSAIMPQYLASFVVPNDPLLPKIKIEAARFLEQWTGSSAFDE